MHIIRRSQHTVFITSVQARFSFGAVTYKNIYEELLSRNYLEHHSVEKWEIKFSDTIDWEKVWISTNNPTTTKEVKTTIWEQIHLNDYCTYNYNKWHHKQDPCPLCLHIPQTKFHLTLDCPVTQNLWKGLEPHLTRLSHFPLTDQEKLFGLKGSTPGIILRNWLTFMLRHCIVE